MHSQKWDEVARSLRSNNSRPSSRQLELGQHFQLPIDSDTPPLVAAAMIRTHLSDPLLLPVEEATDGQFKYLSELSSEEGHPVPVGDENKELVVAWFKTLHARRVAKYLEELKPIPGDVVVINSVKVHDGEKEIYAEVSSIGSSGRIYFHALRGESRWPQHVRRIIRKSEGRSHSAAIKKARSYANLRIKNPYQIGRDGQARLSDWEVSGRPGVDALHALEDALHRADKGGNERPMQVVLEKYPEVLGGLVTGNHGTYVRPQVKLGNKLVPDFFIAGVSSRGIEWTLVEIERPNAQIVLEDGQPSGTLRKSLKQIRDWRHWMAENLETARKPIPQGGEGLEGIRAGSRGLIIIGREGVSDGSEQERIRISGDENIEIRTYDWLIRSIRKNMPLNLGYLDTENVNHLL